jgi:hypothetical protein
MAPPEGANRSRRRRRHRARFCARSDASGLRRHPEPRQVRRRGAAPRQRLAGDRPARRRSGDDPAAAGVVQGPPRPAGHAHVDVRQRRRPIDVPGPDPAGREGCARRRDLQERPAGADERLRRTRRRLSDPRRGRGRAEPPGWPVRRSADPPGPDVHQVRCAQLSHRLGAGVLRRHGARERQGSGS